MEKDFIVTCSILERPDDGKVLVNKKTGEYYLKGKYNNIYFLGKRILTEEEENS